MFDVTWTEWVENFAEDPETKKIILYMEGIAKDASGFLDVARKTSLAGKLVIALKGGKTEEGGKAVGSHTNALAGEDDMLKCLDLP